MQFIQTVIDMKGANYPIVIDLTGVGHWSGHAPSNGTGEPAKQSAPLRAGP
jgi:hypothetical protein